MVSAVLSCEKQSSPPIQDLIGTGSHGSLCVKGVACSAHRGFSVPVLNHRAQKLSAETGREFRL